MALTVVKETSIQVAEQRNLNFIVVVAQYNLPGHIYSGCHSVPGVAEIFQRNAFRGDRRS